MGVDKFIHLHPQQQEKLKENCLELLSIYSHGKLMKALCQTKQTSKHKTVDELQREKSTFPMAYENILAFNLFITDF